MYNQESVACQNMKKVITQCNIGFEGPDIFFIIDCFNASKDVCFRNPHYFTALPCFSYLLILSYWFYFEHLKLVSYWHANFSRLFCEFCRGLSHDIHASVARVS